MASSPNPTPANSEAPITGPRSSSASKEIQVKGNEYQQTCLDHHNQHRANHSAPLMAWDPGLEQSARVVAQTCVFRQKMDVDGGGYGQNIAARYPGGISASEIGKVISNQFYNAQNRI
ncbi:MAG: hypothetical protein M1816_003321 [Peltula sp. TS41687]|nr:MAG: hypothetical protein M1816_003321 [Peltula sp. TS41687]